MGNIIGKLAVIATVLIIAFDGIAFAGMMGGSSGGGGGMHGGTVAVPEPSTLLLLGSGVVGYYIAMRKKDK